MACNGQFWAPSRERLAAEALPSARAPACTFLSGVTLPCKKSNCGLLGLDPAMIHALCFCEVCILQVMTLTLVAGALQTQEHSVQWL